MLYQAFVFPTPFLSLRLYVYKNCSLNMNDDAGTPGTGIKKKKRGSRC